MQQPGFEQTQSIQISPKLILMIYMECFVNATSFIGLGLYQENFIRNTSIKYTVYVSILHEYLKDIIWKVAFSQASK